MGSNVDRAGGIGKRGGDGIATGVGVRDHRLAHAADGCQQVFSGSGDIGQELGLGAHHRGRAFVERAGQREQRCDIVTHGSAPNP